MKPLVLLKSRLKIQHEKLDVELQLVIDAAQEHLTDSGINIKDTKRKNRILNLTIDIAKFYYENKPIQSTARTSTEKLPSYITFEINNLYFAQKFTGVKADD